MVSQNRRLFTTIFVVAALCLITIHAETDFSDANIKKLTADRIKNDLTINPKSGKHSSQYLFFSLEVRDHDSEHIAVNVEATKGFSDPDVFISTSEKHPNSVDTSDRACQRYGDDICLLNGEKVDSGDTLYVGVRCIRECSFNIVANYYLETELAEGETHIITLGPSEFLQVYKFTPPVKEGARHIKISSYPRNPVKNSLFVWKGDVPGGDRVLPSKVAMYDGKIVSVTKNESPSYCDGDDEDCAFYIVVASPVWATFDVTARVETDVFELGQSKSAFDFDSLGKGDFQCYKLNMASNVLYKSTKWSHFRIDVTPFTGNPDVFASFGIAPEAGADSSPAPQYQSKNEFYVDSLIIPKEDVEAAADASGDDQYLFTCVFGTVPTSYSISMWYESNDAIALRYGLTEYAVLEKEDDHRTFIVVADPFLDHNYALDFGIETGAVEVYARLCEGGFHGSCTISSKAKDLLIKSTVVAFDTSLDLAHNPAKCFRDDKVDAKAECLYAIRVVNAVDERSKFSLTPKMDDEVQTLKEGAFVYDDLHENEMACFRYQLDDPTALEVSFTLTPISGDPDLYVSTTHECPDLTKAEKFSAMGDELFDVVKFTTNDYSDLSQTYYVGVKGFSYTYFSIYTQITRKYEDNEDIHAVELRNGRPQRDFIREGQDYTNYYKFILDIPDEDEGKSLRIQLTPIKGEFMVYVSADGRRPTSKHNDWHFSTMDFHNYLVVYSAKEYVKKGTYEVAVQAMTKEVDAETPDNYVVNYVLEGTTSSLVEGIQLAATNLGGMWDFYSIDLHREGTTAKVSMTTKTGLTIMLVSTKFTKPRWFDTDDGADPDTGDNIMENDDSLQIMWGEGTISIDIDEQRAAGLCPEEGSCHIEVGITGIEEINTYSVKYVTAGGKPTLLQMGNPQTDHVSPNSSMFYYLKVDPSSKKDITLAVTTATGRISGHANLLRNPESDQNVWNRPSAKTADFHFGSDAGEKWTVTSAKIEDTCNKSDDYCILFFAITSEDGDTDSTYTITISDGSKMQALQDGKPVKGMIPKDGYVYYTYSVDNENATLIINVSKTSGADPDLVVSKGSDVRPTKTKNDWKSETWASEFLQITVADGYFQKPKVKKTMTGTYVIGIYGDNEGEFSVSVTTQKNPVFQLVSAESQNGLLTNEDQTDFYRYATSYDAELRIELSIVSGFGHMEANRIILDPSNHDFETNLLDRFPHRDRKSDYSSLDGTRNSIVIPEEDHCERCEYLIAVFNETDGETKYSVTASMKGQFVSLMDGKPINSFVSQETTEWFFFPIYNASSIEFTLTSYSGEAKLRVTTVDRVDEDSKPKLKNFIWKGDYSGSNREFTYTYLTSADKKFKATGNYIVAVTGVTDCQFNLAANVDVEDAAFPNAIHLNDGEPIRRIVEGSGSYYLYSPNQKEELVQFMMMVLDEETANLPTVYYQFLSGSQLESHELPDLTKGEPQTVNTLTRNMNLQLDDHFNKNGSYIFLVQPAEDSSHRVQVAVSQWGQNFWILANNTTVEGFASLNGKADGDYYEFFVSQRSHVFVTAEPCNGEIELRFATNFKEARSGTFGEFYRSTIEGVIKSQKTMDPGSYYMMVNPDSTTAIAKGVNDTISYSIRLNIFPETNTDTTKSTPDLYSPGSHGRLTFDPVGDDLKLSWEHVQTSTNYLGTLAENDAQVTYTVFQTPLKEGQRQGGLLSTVCGMRDYFVHDKEQMFKSESNSFTVKNAKNSKGKMTYNVIANISDNRFPSDIQTVAYVPEEVNASTFTNVKEYNKGLIVILIIALIVAALFLALIFIIYKRYKKVEQKLTFEMTDVRNVAGVSGTSEGKLMESERIIDHMDTDTDRV